MSEKRCPTDAELLSFADADLSPERLKRIEQHLQLCGPCAEQVITSSQLTEDIAAPVAQPPLDVAAHVASVMRRLDAPAKPAPGSRRAVWGAVLAAAAAAAALALAVLPRGGGDAPERQFAARGAAAAASLSRDVGVQLYAQESGLRAVGSGGRIRAGTPLTAGLRNLTQESAYLLLFAVDAQHVVHWIAPEFTVAGSDPEAATIAPAAERLLPSSAVFDDLAPGPLRIVALIAREPGRVSEVEALPPEELGAEGLMKRFPRAEVRQFMLEVSAEQNP